MAKGMDALLALMICGLGGIAGYALIKGKLTEEQMLKALEEAKAEGEAEGELIPTEEQVLKALVNAKPRLTHTVYIDTTQPHTNQQYPIAGQSIFVLNPETPSKPAYVRLNELDSDEIELTAQRSIKAPFYRFFVTNEAGTGTLTIIVNKVSVVELSAANINANIVAQTIENLLMTFNAQTVGVYLVPDWATKEGNAKSFRATAFNVARGSGATATYTVPAGKTLYLNYLSAANYAYLGADADKDQMCIALLAVNGVVKLYVGGNGGCAVSFTTPFRVNAGEQLGATVQNWANHNTYVDITVMGYEI